jgi:hypothetical protein
MDIPPSVAALVESAATPFERAHAMPASAYTCPEFLRRELEAIFARVKALLDKVNAEDKACTERVYRGALAGDARPGPLSHLERPNHDFRAIPRHQAGRALARIPGGSRLRR